MGTILLVVTVAGALAAVVSAHCDLKRYRRGDGRANE